MTSSTDIDLARVRWRKSTRSTAEGPNCVEITAVHRSIAVRDSKNPDGPKLIFTTRHWRRFTHEVKRRRYDA